jgi:hypothetical protein
MTTVDWKELFGSDDEDDNVITFNSIPGLTLIKKGITHKEQMTLTHALIKNHNFSKENNVNQSMCFGQLPEYLQRLSDWVTDKYPEIFTEDILNREPLFDQAILNLYEKGILCVCSFMHNVNFFSI